LAAYTTAHIIQLRGLPTDKIDQCITCGSITTDWKDDAYALMHQLGSRGVYQDVRGNTYIDDWLASRIDWKEFKDLRMFEFPVRDHPADGWRLPGDPDWSTMGIPCQEWKSRVLNIPSFKNQDIEPWSPEGPEQQNSLEKLVLPPASLERSLEFRYFAGPTTDMAGFVGESETCSLCGRRGPCFELDYAICPGLSQEARHGKIGCYNCLRAGRFEFWHDSEHGTPCSDQALAELRRTPRIVTDQDERWLTHCRDFMVYQGTWEPADFYENAQNGDGRALFVKMTDPDDQDLWDNCWSDRSQPLSYWYATYYVFKCLRCGMMKGYWDMD
jgi:uncharacterized protein CbrC (UPF0167 family)